MISNTSIGQNITNLRTRAFPGLTKPRRIAYIGGQGDANLGDEAMLAAARRLVDPFHIFDFVYPRQERRLATLGLSGSGYFDAVILGGGTLINPHWLEKARTAIDLGIPIYSLGTGVGSAGFGMATRVDIEGWKPLLSQFTHLGVRGPISEDRLRGLGLDNVEVIGDLALSLTGDNPAPPSETPSFAVNISSAPSSRGESYPALDEMTIVIRRLVKEGWRVVPIAMHIADIEPLGELLERALGTRPRIECVATQERFFELVGPCRFTTAVRLHAAILSACVGVPSLMLGYRDKCLDFMQSMGMENWHVALDEAAEGEIVARSEELARDATTLRRAVHTRALHWRRRIEGYVDQAMPEIGRRNGEKMPISSASSSRREMPKREWHR